MMTQRSGRIVTLAAELGSQGYPGITVNAICPGYVRAGMGVALQATKAGPVSGVDIFERYPRGRVPGPPRVAAITGQALNVDGGFFMS